VKVARVVRFVPDTVKPHAPLEVLSEVIVVVKKNVSGRNRIARSVDSILDRSARVAALRHILREWTAIERAYPRPGRGPDMREYHLIRTRSAAARRPRAAIVHNIIPLVPKGIDIPTVRVLTGSVPWSSRVRYTGRWIRLQPSPHR